MKKMRLALFGGGELLGEVIEKLLQKLEGDLLYIVDNDPQKWGTKQYGLEVVSPESMIKDRPYVIITARKDESIKEIREQCRLLRVQARSVIDLMKEQSYLSSYCEIDYVSLMISCAIRGKRPDKELLKLKKCSGKQIVLFYGNCQIEQLCLVAATSASIGERYFIMRMPPLHNLSFNEYLHGIDEEVLQQVNVLFYQHVHLSNKFSRFLATDYLIGSMGDSDQIKLSIPNLYFDGYFPQLVEFPNKPRNVGGYSFDSSPFFGDKYIMELWDKYDVEDIYSMISDENFISQKIIIDKVNNSLFELKKREMNSDVVISDYIEENYKKRRLSYIAGHVDNSVNEELLFRCFSKVGRKIDDFKSNGVPKADGVVLPIYPSVRKCLELEFSDNGICFFSKLPEKPTTLFEYINTYVKYCKN